VRVLFDGFWWAEGPHANRQVQRDLILAWEAAFRDDALIVAVPRGAVALARQQLPARVDVLATRLRPHGLSVVVELPRLARHARVDLTLSHNFTPRTGRAAVFVHDVLGATNPEWFTIAERAYLWPVPRLLRRASVVYTSSHAEAARIARAARVRGTVHPIGLGMSTGLARATPRRPDSLASVDRAVLAVGRLNVRKNLATVLEAAVASQTVTPEHPLVIAGERSGRRGSSSVELDAAVASGAVRFLGYVDDGELAWLYQHAAPFVFMSLDEGFGMPLLEALHFGAPVVASDIGVFREVLGARGRFVSPLDVAATAAAIDELAHAPRPDPIDVATLGYSWDACARRIRGALEP
jgi:glycosyltransferase involved in cell wall biosynthesis